MIDVPASSFQLQAGPIKVDSERPVAELGSLAAVLAMIVVFRWALKRI